ncbi:MAG: hypothetical protein ACYDBB_22220 [Armatimonadota bacterium]
MDSQSTAVAQPNPGIFDEIKAQAALAQVMARNANVMMAIVAAMMVTGALFIFSVLHGQKMPANAMAFMLVPTVLFDVIFFVVMFRMFSRIQQWPAQILRGAEVVRNGQYTPQRLNVYLRGSGNARQCFVDILDPRTTEDAPPLYTLSLLGQLTDQRTQAITGTEGLVYTREVDDPVVVQTVDGVLIGLRKGVKPAKPGPGKIIVK